ncbi:autotransporter domain-containing protein [Nitrogeniibacter mangrovi]|uniref:Autotransporter domain-containing protein n=1 Tax=Nitrogeniibacter mangrovi TaxID=2016596 RepID=A0A6C1B6X3_9RHOO|nr:autotransporter domain-containing protein [Nitrogeniibacter mangrovi]QID18004.1 autotransporter domain-containing protein [Nitrogeniibacter mangrovi]
MYKDISFAPFRRTAIAMAVMASLAPSIARADIYVDGVNNGLIYSTPGSLTGTLASTFLVTVDSANGGGTSFTVNSGHTLQENNSTTFFVSGGATLGLLDNQGTILGNRFNAINTSASSTVTTFTNSGLIQGQVNGNSAIFFGGAVGSFTNSGTIEHTGSSTAVILNDATSISNSGTIQSVTGHGMILGYLTAATVGNFTNSGTITTGGASGVEAIQFGDGTNASSFGTFTNAGSGVVSNTGSGEAISIMANATVTSVINDGTISSTSTAIANHGTITGANYGIQNNGTITGGITNDGTIAGSTFGFQETAGASLTGGVTNSGSITGTSGGIRMDNATLSGGVANTGTIQGTSFGGIVVSTNGTINGGISNSGTISGATFGVYVSSTSAINNDLTTSGTLSGGIDAIRVDSGGVLNAIHITGNDTASFVGAVNAAGTAVFVDSGATYSMNSGQQFTVSSFTNNGTLAVDAGATGTVTGDYAQGATSTLRTRVTDSTTYGKLAVSGTATFAPGAKIDVDVANPGYVFNVNSLSGVISAGTLSATTFVTTDNSTLFDFAAVKNGNAVDLALSVAGGSNTVLASVNATGNTPAVGVASTLDGIIASDPTGAISMQFIGLGSTQAVSDAASQTLPLLTGQTVAATQATLGSINDVIDARADVASGLSSGDGFVGNRYLWLKPFGSWAEQDKRNGVAGYKATTAGLVMGLDGELASGWRVGGALAYAKSDVNGKSSVAPQDADIDIYQLIGYGRYNLDDRTEVRVQADVGQAVNRGRRRIAFAASEASSDFDSHMAHLGAGISRAYPLGEATRVTPSVSMDYTWIEDEGYTETGAGVLNLKVKQRSTEALVFSVAGRLTHALSTTTTLLADLGVGYDAMSDRDSITAAFAGSPEAAFVTRGVDPSPWRVRGGVGAVYETANGTRITGRYDAEYREDFLNQTASVKVRWLF